MDNPLRTADYLARRGERLAHLRALTARLAVKHPLIVLEIGSGHGHFLNGYAAAHPNEYCVGIDLVRDRLERSEKKRQRARLENVVFVNAEADEFLEAFPSARILQRIFVLFPDPWPKRRHQKNRLIQPEFLSRLAEVSAPRADLCFRTDFAPYYHESLAIVREHQAWQLDVAPHWPFELPTVFQSRAASFQSWIAHVRSPTPADPSH